MRFTPSSVSFALLLLACCGLASAQQPLSVVSGDALGGQLGFSIAVLDDMNGDGKSDFVVGSPLDDTAGNDAGAVRLVSGADGSVIRTVYGEAPGEQLGRSVAFAGAPDPFFGGIGNHLFAAGAPFADPNGTSSGLVRVYFSATGGVAYEINGAAAGDRFGWSLESFYKSGASTIGLRYLAIGAPYSNLGGTDAGSVTIRVASGSVPSFTPNLLTGSQAGMHFGWSIGSVSFGAGTFPAVSFHTRLMIGSPDYDNGGSSSGRVDVWDLFAPLIGGYTSGSFVDAFAAPLAGLRLGTSVAGFNTTGARFVAGAPGTGNGFAYVFDADGTSLSVVKTISGSGGFGSAVARGGNLNAGADEDFLVGAPDTVVLGVEKGKVHAYDGGTYALLWSANGTSEGGRYGAAIAGGVDLEGTGFDDFAVGAPEAGEPGVDSGRLDLRRALNGTTSLFASIEGPATGDGCGRSVAGVGDVNLDGTPDWIVGSPNDANPGLILGAEPIARVGRARVISGATGSSIRSHFGADFGDELGWSVAAIGDVNLDGVPDYAAGAPQRNTLSPDSGYVRVYSGANGALLYDIPGVIAGGEFGFSVGGGSDVNGDGRPDVIIGGPATAFGTVYTYSGASGALLGTLTGQVVGDRFGHSVAGLGADLTGDGKQEYLVGAPFHGDGRVYVMRATTSLLTKWIFDATTAGDLLGMSVARAGDVNRDGTPDILAGAPGHDLAPGFSNSGLARAWSGATGAVLFTVSSAALGVNFGSSVAGLGDVDNDGFDDVAVGAPQGILTTTHGSVRVVSGRTGTTVLSISGTNDGEGLGASVAGIGDLDGDGIPDLAAGAPIDDGNGPNAGLARTISLRPEGVAFYGAASPSCSGPIFLSTSGPATLGSATFAYRTNHSPANALGLLLASNAQDAAGSDLFGLGVSLYVGFLTATEIYGLDLFIDAKGFGATPSPLPSNAYYIGKSYYAQALVAWIGGCSPPPYGLSVSNAVAITIGN